MPPKGSRTLGEDTTMISVRLPRSTVAKLDAHVARMRREHPSLPIGRIHALDDLIRHADEALASGVTDTVTDTTGLDKPQVRRMLRQEFEALMDRHMALLKSIDQAEPVTDTVTDTDVTDTVTTSKTARPKAAAKRKPTRTRKGGAN